MKNSPQRVAEDSWPATLPKMSTSQIVFVIDPDVSTCEASVRLIQTVGLSASSFTSAEEFLKRKKPDIEHCLVTEVRLLGMSGLELQDRLCNSSWEVPVIFLTAYGDIRMVVQAMKAGAIEFLTKPCRDQDLLDAIQLGLKADGQRRRMEAESAEIRRRLGSLTAREREIVKLVISGMPNKCIASQIGIAENTVKVHRSHAMGKIGADSLPALVRMVGILETKSVERDNPYKFFRG